MFKQENIKNQKMITMLLILAILLMIFIFLVIYKKNYVFSKQSFVVQDNLHQKNIKIKITDKEKKDDDEEKDQKKETEKIKIIKKEILRVKKPQHVKALYYNTTAIRSQYKQESLFRMVKDKKINSVIFDIKEVDGKIAFKMDKEEFSDIVGETNFQFKNIESLVKKLHEHNIYVIARMVVFKDNFLVEKYPELLVKKGDQKTIWKDYTGHKYIDPFSERVWDYQVDIASAAYKRGFDEINFDYIRFPSDGNMNDIYFPFSDEILKNNKKWGKSIIMDSACYYITEELRKRHPNIILSADVFGMTTEDYTDLGIGQVLESFLLHFDYVSPMTYPSHYPSWYLSLENPDDFPFVVLNNALVNARKKIVNLNKKIILKDKNQKIELKPGFVAQVNIDKVKKIDNSKIRVWLQGFSCSWCKHFRRYDREEIQAQIRAVKNNDLNSWMVWNPSGRYSEWWFDIDQ